LPTLQQQEGGEMSKKKNLLIDEYPLMVLPSLAKTIGLNEAIALQQLHYWLENAKGGVDRDGHRWVYNTYEKWQEDNFPFWSIRTIQRVFLNLENDGLVIAAQLDKTAYDRKKYYRIDYDKLSSLTVTSAPHQSRQGNGCDSANLTPSLDESETTTETTTEKYEEEVRNPLFSFYENKIGAITPLMADAIEKAEKVYTSKWVADAIELASEKGARHWNYCEAVLKRWKQEGRAERPGKRVTAAQSGDNSKYLENEYADYIEH
jgi:DnaD/phage-associated family protein